jgi:glycosyltransferase involved in cell wall biosynthesis
MIKVTVLVSLYRCATYVQAFLELAVKLQGKEIIEFLLLHNDPLEEELFIIIPYLQQFPHIQHIIIKEREGLYGTWNRGIRLAKGAYITIWNVDDIRFPDSIRLQAKALDENPAAAIAYGDMFGSNEYGKYGNKLYQYPEWKDDKEEFFRSYMMSCFQMWRKSIHDSIGYYDEQFRCVADFDFQIRAALHFSFIKVSTPLGVYLEDMPHKISSDLVQGLENNVIYYRYGVYEKIQLPLLKKSLATYKKNCFLFFGEWVTNTETAPFGAFRRFKGMLVSILTMPAYFARSIRNNYFKRPLLN